MEIKLLSINGSEEGSSNLPDILFSQKPNVYFLHEIVKHYLSNKRRGCASTKTRSEVRGGGKKPWKQKHTGRSRQGSIRSPLWRKGGVVFGPKPRSWREGMPAEKRRKALCQALSLKYGEKAVFAAGELKFAEPKAKSVKPLFKALGAEKKDRILFVDVKTDRNFAAAVRNFGNVAWSDAMNLNAYDVLRADKLVITPKAAEALAGFLKGGI